MPGLQARVHEAMTIRLEIAPGDHFDVVVKPFHELTVADHIRLYESNELDEGATPLALVKNRIKRLTGAPERFVRAMGEKDADSVMTLLDEQTNAHDKAHKALQRVHETLSNWKDEHDGVDFTVEDARAVMQDHGLFKNWIQVGEETYLAPDVERSPFGKWIDLQEAMVAADSSKEAESMSYVRALAIMMEGKDGAFPVQGQDEADADYITRANEYQANRINTFKRAKWVDVMGCAAFFFSRSQRFAALCGHNMTRFRSLRPQAQEPVLRVIPKDGEGVWT